MLFLLLEIGNIPKRQKNKFGISKHIKAIEESLVFRRKIKTFNMHQNVKYYTFDLLCEHKDIEIWYSESNIGHRTLNANFKLLKTVDIV